MFSVNRGCFCQQPSNTFSVSGILILAPGGLVEVVNSWESGGDSGPADRWNPWCIMKL